MEVLILLKSARSYSLALIPYDFFSQNYNIASHTTIVMCVDVLILLISARNYSLMSISNAKVFVGNIFLVIFARNLPRDSRQRNIFLFFIFCLNHGLVFNKPTHYLLGYGHFQNRQKA